MQIIKLTHENFQAFKNETFNFDGKDTNIYGDNATGKTTVFNSLTWLFFGKSSTGSTGFSPKTKGTDGEDVHLYQWIRN